MDARVTPERALLNWLEQLSDGLPEALIRGYILMSSPTSDEFALTDEEASSWFHHQIAAPDFPLRRVARILSVRTMFHFLLYQPYLESQWLVDVGNLHYLHSARFHQARRRWEQLLQQELSDQNLMNWLTELQGF